MEILYKKTIYNVSLALRLIDDFTGKILQGPGYSFHVNDVPVQPIRKQDGYFIITGLNNNAFDLRITSPWYCSKEIPIAADDTGQISSPIDIRLYPGFAYAMLAGATVYRGEFSSVRLKSLENISVMLITDFSNGRIKLKSVDKKEDMHTITLQNPNGTDLTGFTISFCNDEKDGPLEIVTLKQCLEGNTYQTDVGLPAKYASGTPVYRVFRSFTDIRGRVLIPAEAGSAPETEGLMKASKEELSIGGKRILKSGTTTTYSETI